jgi:serine/threonine protein kinase
MTFHHLAPERLSQDAESKAVDMWSIGCILYFLLFGVPPFYSQKQDEEEHEDEIYDAVLEGTVKFPSKPQVSDMAKDLILRLLAKDPTVRYTADQTLAHPWIRVCGTFYLSVCHSFCVVCMHDSLS